jgi:hypothetical protein
MWSSMNSSLQPSTIVQIDGTDFEVHWLAVVSGTCVLICPSYGTRVAAAGLLVTTPTAHFVKVLPCEIPMHM